LDNITHSLVGAALSEIAARESATPTERRLFLAAGILSSNLPDLDLLYVGLTPPPLGYLLHHRGHTHTLVGLVVQGLLGWMLCRLVPAVRRLAAGDRARLLSLIAAGLLSHELLDAGNNYGVLGARTSRPCGSGPRARPRSVRPT
jgi:inner membrane protein